MRLVLVYADGRVVESDQDAPFGSRHILVEKHDGFYWDRTFEITYAGKPEDGTAVGLERAFKKGPSVASVRKRIEENTMRFIAKAAEVSR